MNRRDFLKAAALGSAVAAAGVVSPLAAAQSRAKRPVASKRSYKHRAAFGCWINDMRNGQIPSEDWPSGIMDEETVSSAIRALDVQKWAGYTELNVAGLFTTRYWEPDIPATVDMDRRNAVSRIIDAAHKRGIKVLPAFGVYSWGFEKIIKHAPAVKGSKGDPHAMCGASPEAWTWMAKVLDYMFNEYDIDGLHLEASDEGRCYCPSCEKISDVIYFNMLNARTADYIRGKWPNKKLLVNMCGYLRTDREATPEEIDDLVKLGDHIDYLIDGGHVKFIVGESIRRDFCSRTKCSYGTSGGTWIYNPQRWPKLRWFVPYTRLTGQHLKDLYEDGGRACEYYQGPTINPGVEVNMGFGGRLMCDVDASLESVLREVLRIAYEPKSESALDRLYSVFSRAETSFWENTTAAPPRTAGRRGEVHFAELFGNAPGPAGHLRAMTAEQRARYRDALQSIRKELIGLEKQVESREKVLRIAQCVDTTLFEADEVDAGRG